MPSRGSELVDALYLDTFAGRGWQQPLAAAADWLDCRAIGVVVMRERPRATLLTDCGGPAAALCQRYVRDYLLSDIRIPRLFAHADELVTDAELMSAPERQASPLHRELLAHFDGAAVLLAKLECDDHVRGFAQFFRTPTAGRFDDTALARVRGLLPHLGAALRLRRNLPVRPRKAIGAAATPASANATAALFMLDRRRNVVDMNRSAHDLIQHHGLFTIRGRRLQANDDAHAVELDRLLNLTINEEATTRSGHEQRIARISCTCSRPLTLIALPADESMFGVGTEQTAMALVVVENDPRCQDSEWLLRSVYGLAPMQARLAACIAEGHTLSEAAVQLGISRNTAKTHLNGAFEKTNTSSQVELCALVNRQLAAFDPVLAARHAGVG